MPYFCSLFSSPTTLLKTNSWQMWWKWAAHPPLEKIEQLPNFPKASLPDNYYSWPLWKFPGKPNSLGLPDSGKSQVKSAFSSWAIVKDNQQQLLNIIYAWGSDSSGDQQEVNQKVRNKIFIGGFEKLWHIFGNLKDQVHSYSSIHAQERPEKVLCSYLWMTLRIYAGIKWRLRENYKLLACLSIEVIPQDTHSPLTKGWRPTGFTHLS